MSDLTTYTFGQLVSDIKIVSRNSGNTELDPYIKNCVNETLAQYTALNRYTQLFVKDSQLNLTLANGTIPLPLGLQHLDRLNIRYFTANTNPPGTLLRKYDKYRSTDLGSATQFIRQDSQLLITPFADILGTDYLLIDYWKFPTVLVDDGDIFPIPDLIPVIKNEVIAKVTTFDDPKQWQRYKAEAKQSYVSTRSIDD